MNVTLFPATQIPSYLTGAMIAWLLVNTFPERLLVAQPNSDLPNIVPRQVALLRLPERGRSIRVSTADELATAVDQEHRKMMDKIDDSLKSRSLRLHFPIREVI